MTELGSRGGTEVTLSEAIREGTQEGGDCDLGPGGRARVWSRAG